MSRLIKFGISIDYISDWGFKEAYREILQNFLDYGNYDIKETNISFKISNNYLPENLEFLKIGFSSKKDKNNRGKHGEGIKMAMLVLYRLGLSCCIRYNNNIIRPKIYRDDLLGDCFGLDISEIEEHSNFMFYFEKPDNFKEYENFIISDEDIIYTSHWGRIVKRDIGSIYVGGLYVTKVDSLSYAYDLNVDCINLGRDRMIPSTFDIEYHCSMINESYISSIELKYEDCNFENRDFNYFYNAPKHIVKNVKPFEDAEGEIYFEDNEGKKINNYKLINLLKNDNTIKEKITKMRFELIEKKSPHTLIKFFNDRYSKHLPECGKTELNSIQYQSLDWRFKNEN